MDNSTPVHVIAPTADPAPAARPTVPDVSGEPNVLAMLRLDWVSPGLDGLQLAQWLKVESKAWAALVVVGGWMYGCERVGETVVWPCLGRVVGRRPWEVFFAAAARNYRDTGDLMTAVDAAIDDAVEAS